tara:strand:+ start:808 stop:1158 length:351 start_codon:yes stop_codon:yes gene_type:complete
MFYKYNTTSGQVLGMSNSQSALQNNLQSGEAIVEQASAVGGYISDMTVTNGVVSGDNTNRLSDQVRTERDRLLAETDWWASSDLTMTAAQTTYRQDLRDIPSQSGFPSNVTWPTKP